MPDTITLTPLLAAILADRERPITLHAAADDPLIAPNGRRLHVAQLHRWAKRGVRSIRGQIVKLETTKYASAICTSREALQRFKARLDDCEAPQPQLPGRAERVAQARQIINQTTRKKSA